MQSKIAEKEAQIEDIKKQIEVLTKKQQQQQKQKETEDKQRKRKAVRIQEPIEEAPDGRRSSETGGATGSQSSPNQRHLEVGHGHRGPDADPMSDSGIASNRNSRPSEPSDFEFSESYL